MELEELFPTIFLILVLFLVVPAFLRLNLNLKQFIKNLIIWSVIIVSVMVVSYLIFQ